MIERNMYFAKNVYTRIFSVSLTNNRFRVFSSVNVAGYIFFVLSTEV